MIAPLAGAFAPLRVLERMPETTRRRLFGELRRAGLTSLLTEGASLPAWLAQEVRRADLGLGSGFACFSDHAGAVARVAERLRPITAAGDVRPQMEWYRGIIPTDREYERELIRACVRAATELSLDLFVLDFIRWPLHWEIELRDGARVIETSFDGVTLGRFRDELGVRIPIDDPAAAARQLTNELREEWTSFKCRVITEMVERIARELRRARPGLPVGAFIVPGDDDQRRRYAGQDVAGLSRHLDVLLPMTYHAILQRPVSWIRHTVKEMRERAESPVVPVIQATADPEIAAGNDWGRPFTPAEFADAIDAALDVGGWGFVTFPAHGLSPVHLEQLAPRAHRAADLARRQSR